MQNGAATLRLGPVGAGVVGAVVALAGAALLILALDRVLPFLAGIPAPAPWTVSPGLVLALVSAPGAAMYLAGYLALPRATRIGHVIIAMGIALALVVGGCGLVLAVLSLASA